MLYEVRVMFIAMRKIFLMVSMSEGTPTGMDTALVDSLVQSLPQMKMVINAMLQSVGAEMEQLIEIKDDTTIDYIIRMKFGSPEIVKHIAESMRDKQ